MRIWVPLAAAVTGLCLLVEVTVQQSYRSALNDPQIQLAEDAAALAANGIDPHSLVPPEPINIARSLAPYLVIYDDAAQPIAASGLLSGVPPQPPPGVFAAARARGENRVSWQPRADVRSAVVVRHFSGEASGFVLAGRNMREVEARETNLRRIVLLGWGALLAGTLAATIAAQAALRWT